MALQSALRLIVVIAGLVLAITTFVGCGGADKSVPADHAGTAEPTVTSETSPSSFVDDFTAALSSDDEKLWLAIIGQPQPSSDGLELAVFESTDGASWHPLPSPPGRDLDGSLFLTNAAAAPEHETTPCLGYITAGGSQIRCLAHGQWQGVGRPTSKQKHRRLIDLTHTADGELLALYSNREDRFLLEVERLADGDWHQTGAAIDAGPALAQFVEPVTASQPLVGLETQGRESVRVVIGRRHGKWVRLGPALRAPAGPLPDGPVTTSRSVFFPLTTADRQPWRFFVASRRIARSDRWRMGQALSGNGNAQGTVAVIDGHPWAIWQENDPRKDGLFDTVIRTEPIKTATGSDLSSGLRLWRGESIGPGTVQLLGTPSGRHYALYPRATTSGSGLRATVAAIEP